MGSHNAVPTKNSLNGLDWKTISRQNEKKNKIDGKTHAK